ncbi:GNPAT [Cordylochernes scorpioides]|uniref:GNPAT n=1 Tax=Cordylochernes scorpioides TaxID=51811 RepID=A0ABY6L1U7_9ARAC|nr:GNPAT [Cordylochernes scorpioides]
MEAARAFLEMHRRDGDQMFSRIVTGDESWMHHSTPETKRQSMVWEKPEESAPKKAKGVLLVDYLPPNTTVNAARYCEVLTKLRAAIKRKRPGLLSRKVLLVHDNARPHAARTTQTLLEKFKWKIFTYPPYSPELTPRDFHLFPALKLHLGGKHFANDDEVQAEVNHWLRRQDTAWYNSSIKKIATTVPKMFRQKWPWYSWWVEVGDCFYYFLGLKFVSTLLRNCGAFFIRRHFADDKLYWTVFSVYLQSLLEGGEHPVEFFVEGTRSRSAKSLTPKLGLLKVALELFFTAKVPDLTIVPISITYERTLEEDLFAYEMLGIPKPKESTRGLVKARKILEHNYGNIYIKYGDPISVRDFCGPTLDRSHHNLESRYEVSLSPLEQVICSDLGSHIVRTQQHNLAVTALSAVCLLVSVRPEGIPVEQLVQQMGWLHSLLSHMGSPLPWSPFHSPQQLMKALAPHSRILRPGARGTICLAAMLDEEPALKRALDPKAALSALPHLLAQHYANQPLQLLARPCMVAVCLLQAAVPAPTKDHPRVANLCLFVRPDSLLAPFLTLRRLLAREFVFERAKEEEDLEQGLEPMFANGMITIMETGHLEIHIPEELAILAAMLNPFLLSYQSICRYLSTRGADAPPLPSKEMAQQCQAAQDGPRDWRTLSLDTIANCISMMVQERALRREKSPNGTFLLHTIPSEVSRIAMELAPFIQKGDQTPIPRMVLPLAKL